MLSKNRKQLEKEKYFKKINSVISGKQWINLNPYFEYHSGLFPPIDIMFSRDLPSSHYGIPFSEPFNWLEPLERAIDDQNRVLIRIGLNHKRADIEKKLSSLLTILNRELKRIGRKRFILNDREFDFYLQVINLRENKGWTYERIAEKVFPGDFKITKSGGKRESAITKVKQIFKEGKDLEKRLNSGK